MVWQWVLGDIRYAIRRLVRYPGFGVAVVVSMALTIAATASIFSIVYAALVRPLPYKHADRIVSAQFVSPRGVQAFFSASADQVPPLKQLPDVEDVLLVNTSTGIVSRRQYSETARICQLGRGGFEFLGTGALVGRTFGEEAHPGSFGPEKVAVLGYDFWQRSWGASANVVGSDVKIDGESFRVVGIMPQMFRWQGADVYIPLKLSSAPPGQEAPVYGTFIKLRSNANWQEASAELMGLIRRLIRQSEHWEFPSDIRVRFEGLQEQMTAGIGPNLWMLFGAVLLLLAIGCANIAIMTLARCFARGGELETRFALGATKSRIFSQLLFESIALALVGGACGLGLAYLLVDSLKFWLPVGILPSEVTIQMNGWVFAFSLVAAVASGVGFGVFPAFWGSRFLVTEGLVGNGRPPAQKTRGRLLHDTLCFTEFGLTVLLLTSALMTMQAFLSIYRTPLGFDPHNLLRVNLISAPGSPEDWGAAVEHLETARNEIARLPGVRSVSLSETVPPFTALPLEYALPGQPFSSEHKVLADLVDERFFATLRIPMLRGDTLSKDDIQYGRAHVVVNRAFADQFPNRDPIGHKLLLPGLMLGYPGWLRPSQSSMEVEIVGVVGDARNTGLTKLTEPEVFIPFSKLISPYVSVSIRTVGPPEFYVRSIRGELLHVASGRAITSVKSYEDMLAELGWARERFLATLLGLFSVLAVALAAIGLYGAISYSVSQRVNEFGVRAALGATQVDLLYLVVVSKAWVVIGGIAAGILVSAWAGDLLQHWGIRASLDRLTLVEATVSMLVVALAASLIPAWRAANLEPMTALRRE